MKLELKETKNFKKWSFKTNGNTRGLILIMEIGGKFTAKLDYWTGGSAGNGVEVKEKAKFQTFEEAYRFVINEIIEKTLTEDGQKQFTK